MDGIPLFITQRDFVPCKGFRIPESRKFLRVEFAILDSGIRNTAVGIWNPTDNWNPESKFHWKRSGIQSLESGIHGVGSRIQDCLGSLYIWGEQVRSCVISTVERRETHRLC